MYPLDIIQTHYNKVLLSGFPLSTDRASLDHNYTQSFLSGHKTSKKLGKCTICRSSSIPMILNIMITEVSDPLGHTLLIFLSRESCSSTSPFLAHRTISSVLKMQYNVKGEDA